MELPIHPGIKVDLFLANMALVAMELCKVEKKPFCLLIRTCFLEMTNLAYTINADTSQPVVTSYD